MLRPVEEQPDNKPAQPKETAAKEVDTQSALGISIPPEASIYSKSRAEAERAAAQPTLKVQDETKKSLRKESKKKNTKAMDLIPLGDQEGLKMPKNRPAWLRVCIEIYDGLIIAALMLISAGFIAYSYTQMPRPWLAWLAFIPFGMAILNMRSTVMSFFFGIGTGTIAYLGILYWIMPTVQVGTGDLQMASAAVFSLSLVLSLQFALFSLCSNYVKRIKWLFPLAGASLWVLFELLHQAIALKFTAFPWFVLGYTQYLQLELIQISSVTGVYGVSFLIVFLGFSLALAFNSKPKAVMRIAYLILGPLVVMIAYMSGSNILKQQESFLGYNTQKISVALMQANTHQLLLDGFEEDVIYLLYDQVAALEDKKVDLILWPESSYPGSFQQGDYYNFMIETSASLRASQITGSVFESDGKEYVSAGFFDSERLKGVYNKTKIVPFGEFLPLYSIFGNLYDRHGISSFTGTFSEGDDPGKIFELSVLDKYNDRKVFFFGTEICFESLFPSIFRAQAAKGAQFFVNISNDGWFLDTSAPYQHLRVNVFRAVENRRPLLRSTNTGLSAWISALGEIKFSTELNKQETALFDFYFQPRAGRTFYTTHGDLFGLVCSIIALTTLIISLVFFNTNKHDRT